MPTKNQTLSRLALPFFLLGLILSCIAYIPLIRKTLSLSTEFELPFSTTLILLISGLMAAIGGMISLSRQHATRPKTTNEDKTNSKKLSIPHWLGLSALLMIPFLSFIIIYVRWQHPSQQTAALDQEHRKALNFQITIQLYSLLSLFLAPIGIGFLLLALTWALHIIGTIWVASRTLYGKNAHYPANINIIPSL